MKADEANRKTWEAIRNREENLKQKIEDQYTSVMQSITSAVSDGQYYINYNSKGLN